ncbi:MAG TPA: helix-turn-helix domain-containing protein [Actinomycetota bacterium]|nr:helix-turn-helix domain-containing protein [Actinomycetota bacterium]
MAEPAGRGDQFEETDVYLRTAEAAKILRVSGKTVSRWAKDGKIPHVITLGGHRRFPETAVRRLADRLSIEATNESSDGATLDSL